ncbi:MAG: hypothetical protein EOO27_29820, partial [Comamonadaceae bacterium]
MSSRILPSNTDPVPRPERQGIGVEGGVLIAAIVVLGAPLTPLLFGAPWTTVQGLQVAFMLGGTLPAAVFVVLAADRLERVPRRQTLLTRRLPGGFGVLWGGLTFTLGAYLASLLAMDLSTTSTNSLEYFGRTLMLFGPPVVWFAAVVVFVPAAWELALATPDARARATLKLVRQRRRESWPLATRMWLDDPGARLPTSLSMRQAWWARQLSQARLAWSLVLACGV